MPHFDCSPVGEELQRGTGLGEQRRPQLEDLVRIWLCSHNTSSSLWFAMSWKPGQGVCGSFEIQANPCRWVNSINFCSVNTAWWTQPLSGLQSCSYTIFWVSSNMGEEERLVKWLSEKEMLVDLNLGALRVCGMLNLGSILTFLMVYCSNLWTDLHVSCLYCQIIY